MPAPGVADIADRHQALNNRSKIERGAHHQKTLGPREAFELDSKGSPHVTARPVSSDQPLAGLRGARFLALDNGANCRIILAHAHDSTIELQIEISAFPQQVQ